MFQTTLGNWYNDNSLLIQTVFHKVQNTLNITQYYQSLFGIQFHKSCHSCYNGLHCNCHIYLILCTDSRCLKKLACIRDLYGQYWQAKWVSHVTIPQPIFRCFRRFEAHEYIWPHLGHTCNRGRTMGNSGGSEIKLHVYVSIRCIRQYLGR